MHVLLVHNYYQLPGGEDELFTSTRELLRALGHDVLEYVRRNEEILHYGFWHASTLPLRTLWASDTRRDFRELLAAEKPDVVQFYNTFPLISPAVYSTCREFRIPVIQSLDNPRLICPAATFYRNGHACQECLGKTPPWPGVLHACYRDSRIQTSAVATMLTLHRVLGTWEKQVNLYMAATNFYRRKFIEGGLPAEKIVVKPHFVHPDPGLRDGPGTYALFVGRLAPEKGVPSLLKAWEQLPHVPLKIRGEGPLLTDVQNFVNRNHCTVKWLPRLPQDELIDLIKGAQFLVWPSEGYYETFGLIAVEAFACGVPVIASGLGAMAETVEDGRTGLHFRPGDPDDLAAKVEWAWTHPKEMEAMGREARADYEAKYTAERNYQMLMDIYLRVRRCNV